MYPAQSMLCQEHYVCTERCQIHLHKMPICLVQASPTVSVNTGRRVEGSCVQKAGAGLLPILRSTDGLLLALLLWCEALEACLRQLARC